MTVKIVPLMSNFFEKKNNNKYRVLIFVIFPCIYYIHCIP